MFEHALDNALLDIAILNQSKLADNNCNAFVNKTRATYNYVRRRSLNRTATDIKQIHK